MSVRCSSIAVCVAATGLLAVAACDSAPPATMKSATPQPARPQESQTEVDHAPGVTITVPSYEVKMASAAATYRHEGGACAEKPQAEQKACRQAVEESWESAKAESAAMRGDRQ